MYAQIPALVNSLYAIRSVEAGIPNILGQVSSSGQSAVFENSSGALSSTNSMGTPPQNGSGRWSLVETLTFNARNSSNTYGSSSTVTPLSRKTIFMIKY